MNATSNTEQRNKAIVNELYNGIYNPGRADLLKTVFAANLIQHDPTVANGIEGEMAYLQGKLAQEPRPFFIVKHLLAYGDFVAAHVQVTATPDNEFSGQAELDLFRFNQQGTIVEHWESIQDVPATSLNGHSMFSTLYPESPIPVTEQQEEANKALVLDVANRLFNEGDLSVLDQYWDAKYIQHNPLVANGVDGLKAVLANNAGLLSHFNIEYAIADGNYVLLFQQAISAGGDPNNQFAGIVVADLYHVINGKTVEHWDVLQNVPATSINGHSMFSSLYQG